MKYRKCKQKYIYAPKESVSHCANIPEAHTH
jgi:rRNA maturation protein Nop10